VALPFSALAQRTPADTRPFGKYLLRICTWDLQRLDAHCDEPSQKPEAALTPQSIDFEQVAPPGAPPSQKPTYPLIINESFFVSAKATSGLPVNIRVLAGAVDLVATLPEGVFQYRVRGPGTVVMRADRDGDSYYEPASPVTLVFDVGPASASSCDGLFPLPATPREIPTVDAAAIVGLLGVPTPYVLTAVGSHTILIYTARDVFAPTEETRVTEQGRGTATRKKKVTGIGSQSDSEKRILDGFRDQIQALLNRNADALGIPASTPFSVELKIPHASALGDLATRIGGLNYSQLTVTDVGSGKIRVSAASQPACKLWSAFLKDVHELVWQLHPEPWNSRLFYLGQNTGVNGASATGAADLATAFNALSPAAPAATTSAAPAPPAAATATPNASISVSQPAGSMVEVKSDTTPCVAAGLATGNSSACAPAAATPAAAAATAPAAPTATMAPLESDLLLFSTANSGNDEAIAERKRIIAQLDLPRPEMIINGWVLQNSTTSSRAIGAFAAAVKGLVSNYNQSLENVVLKSFGYVRSEIAGGNFFNAPFYHYIADRYVGDTQSAITGTDPQSAAQQFLDTTRAKLTFPDGTDATDYGICATGHYCLGYSTLFQPVKPRLTDVLLALIAAKDTLGQINNTIDRVEGPAKPAEDHFCDNAGKGDRERCNSIWKDLDLDHGDGNACEDQDLRRILGSAFPAGTSPARVFLRCFRQEAETLLAGSSPSDPATSPSGAGIMRAAVANFLFNYKMSQQFPHEFKAYDLSQSADALNSALSPLIDAFNRDITTFQRFVRADVQYRVKRINHDYDDRCCVKRLFGLDKPSFFNEGIVTVRTISGQWTYASTTSQSFLNASSAPQLTDLLNSLTAAPASSSTTPGTPPISALLHEAGPLSKAQLAAAFLNNYQTTYAQIGRSLAISAIPRSLATASAAEIVVSLNADDAANPPVYVGGQQSGAAANISRVANHDTSTRVRVDSMKLFEVSSFSAVLQRSRSRIPLVPPLVEIPYIGTIAGIPVPPATEYHQSTALLSAVVVPTAADIAYGLQFQFDETAEGSGKTCSLLRSAKEDDRCRLRRLISLTDFGERNSVNLYNREIVHCFATDMRSAYSSINGFTAASANACANLSFDSLPDGR